MKLFAALLGTETNTFSPMPTGWNVWKQSLLVRKGDTRSDGSPLVPALLRPIFERLESRGWEAELGLCAFAEPAGKTPDAVWQSLRDELLRDLEAAMPVDAVVLFLHGAMVAESVDDCEGELLRLVRERVGADVPVGAELDLHCHLTDEMFRHATALVGYKEYPHTDVLDRFLELLDILLDTAEGRVRPVMARFPCQMIGLYHTTREPMRGFVDRLQELESEAGILNAWIGHGFPYGDVPSIGTNAVVVADGNRALAEKHAERLGRELYALRHEIASAPSTIDACIDAALAEPEGPVTIGDTGDNPGGGAPCDSTFFLRRLIERGVENAAVGPLWDPVAVGICQDAGVGSTLRLRIGGKLGETSGDPVDVTATVIGLAERLRQGMGGASASLGACAGIKVHRGELPSDVPAEGIDVTLSSVRTQGRQPSLFGEVGIDPEAKRILVVKSTQHFHAGFEPISTRILYAGDHGALQGDVTTIPYQRVRTERYWPFREDAL